MTSPLELGDDCLVLGQRLAEWASRPAGERPFLVLDLRISRSVIAPYQREVIRVNS